MIDEEQFEKWKKLNEEEIKRIDAEILEGKNQLKILRQRRDAAILSSFPGGFRPSMDLKTITLGEWVEKYE